jgi:hypothetical protein
MAAAAFVDSGTASNRQIRANPIRSKIAIRARCCVVRAQWRNDGRCAKSPAGLFPRSAGAATSARCRADPAGREALGTRRGTLVKSAADVPARRLPQDSMRCAIPLPNQLSAATQAHLGGSGNFSRLRQRLGWLRQPVYMAPKRREYLEGWSDLYLIVQGSCSKAPLKLLDSMPASARAVLIAVSRAMVAGS